MLSKNPRMRKYWYLSAALLIRETQAAETKMLSRV